MKAILNLTLDTSLDVIKMDDDSTYLDMDYLIFGCGNILFGDDAFGPKTIDHFNEKYELPIGALALNVETSIRGLLFNLVLSDKKPRIARKGPR